MASIVDAAGLALPVGSTAPAAEILERFSRSRTLQVTPPTSKCVRRVNYRNWLVQTVSEPWLLTQGGTVGDGRQIYPDSTNDQRSPVIRFAAQYVTGVPGQLIGFIRVAATYNVRGRRLDTITASSISNLMRCAGLHINDLDARYFDSSRRNNA